MIGIDNDDKDCIIEAYKQRQQQHKGQHNGHHHNRNAGNDSYSHGDDPCTGYQTIPNW